MPSILPTPLNNYLIQEDTPLDPDTLNEIFGSIGNRLVAQEAQIVDWEAAVDNLNNLGLQVIAENLAPQIQAARDQVTLLQSQANAVEDQIAALISAGIFASGVTVTPIAGLNVTNTTVQLALASLLAKIGTNGTAIDDLAEATADALALKADTSALAALRAGLGSVITGNLTAVAGGEYYVKTATGAVTITLPIAPTDGNTVTVWRFGANAVSIARNGKTINMVADDIQIDADRVFLQLKYFDGNWAALPGKF